MMLCSLLVASSLALPAAEGPMNSVQYFESRNNVTRKTLERTICADVERIHPYTAPNGVTYEKAETDYRRDVNLGELRNMCVQFLIAVGLKEHTQECAVTSRPSRRAN